MSKPIRRFLSFVLALQLIIPYSTFAAAVGEFSSVVGGVTQTRAREVITPIVKSPVEMKDLIATALTSSATMVFTDDSTIRLSEKTKLEIKEFLFKDKSRTGIFSLFIGKVTANVKKYIGGDNVFEIYSPSVGVGVRGTGFEFDEAVTPEKMGKATVACTEGSLNLSALGPKGEVVSKAVLEAGQMAVITAGVITISAIGAAAAAAIAKATETGAAGAAGGAGTGTGGAAAAGGGAAAATGMSTAAIAGIAIGGAAVIGGAAAVAGGGGGGGSSSSSSSSGGGTTPPTTTCSNSDGKWSGTRSPGCSNDPSDTGGTWVMNCSSCSCDTVWISNNGSTHPGNCTILGNSVSCTASVIACGTQNTPCTVYVSGTISGNSVSGTYSGSGCNGLSGTWTGAKQ